MFPVNSPENSETSALSQYTTRAHNLPERIYSAALRLFSRIPTHATEGHAPQTYFTDNPTIEYPLVAKFQAYAEARLFDLQVSSQLLADRRCEKRGQGEKDK